MTTRRPAAKAALTKIERGRIAEVVAGSRAVDTLKKPAAWHQVVHHYNWDDGVGPLEWIAANPKCDRGTALFIYWRASPEHYIAFKSRKARDEVAAANRATYDLVCNIEERFARGFYQASEIAYDPKSDDPNPDGHGLPSEMTHPTPGVPCPAVSLETVYLRHLNDRERTKVAHRIQRATALLGDAGADEATPTQLIAALTTTLTEIAADPERARGAEPLDWLYLDLIHRAYNWQWLAWDWETGANLGVFTPDRSWCCLERNLVKHAITGGIHDLTAADLPAIFSSLAAADNLSTLTNLQGAGLLKAAHHLPYRPREAATPKPL